MSTYRSFGELLASGRRWTVLYADPPWNFSNSNVKYASGHTANVKDHYGTLDLEDLKGLPVDRVADEVCALLMWTTDAHLEWALDVGKAWGFKYSTVQFVWEKLTSKGNTAKVLGPWGMKSAEQCLLFTRGKAHSQLLGARNTPQLHRLERGHHSEKPLLFKTLICRMFPLEQPLELFSRQAAADNWDHMGDEL